MAYIPGYLATISVNGTAINPDASDAGLTLTNETLDKTTLGQPERNYIPGLQDGSIAATMHLNTTSVAAIQAAFASATVVAFVFRPGAVGTHDAGQWAGDAIISSMDINGAVEDNWSIALDLQVSGAVTYTAPV